MREKKKRCKKRQRFWLTRYGGRVTFFYKGIGSTSSTSPSFYRVRRKHVHRAGRSMITSSQVPRSCVFFLQRSIFYLFWNTIHRYVSITFEKFLKISTLSTLVTQQTNLRLRNRWKLKNRFTRGKNSWGHVEVTYSPRMRKLWRKWRMREIFRKS